MRSRRGFLEVGSGPMLVLAMHGPSRRRVGPSQRSRRTWSASAGGVEFPAARRAGSGG